MVYCESNRLRIIKYNKQTIMVVNFNWFWYSLLYLCNVYTDPCTNNCHPWWLVAGSIPVMISYGHGFGDSKMVRLNILCFSCV